MRNLINQFVELYNTNETFQKELEGYDRIIKTKQWKFLMDAFLTIKGTMLNDLLSERFTNLDVTEKDITQKVYHNITEILDFLSNPEKWMRRKNIYKQFSSNLAKRIAKRS